MGQMPGILFQKSAIVTDKWRWGSPMKLLAGHDDDPEANGPCEAEMLAQVASF